MTVQPTSSIAAAPSAPPESSEAVFDAFPAITSWQPTTPLECAEFPSPAPVSSSYGTSSTSGAEFSIYVTSSDAQAAFESMKAWITKSGADPTLCGGTITAGAWQEVSALQGHANFTFTTGSTTLPGQSRTYSVCGTVLYFVEPASAPLPDCR